jgi:hypothetical protein
MGTLKQWPLSDFVSVHCNSVIDESIWRSKLEFQIFTKLKFRLCIRAVGNWATFYVSASYKIFHYPKIRLQIKSIFLKCTRRLGINEAHICRQRSIINYRKNILTLQRMLLFGLSGKKIKITLQLIITNHIFNNNNGIGIMQLYWNVLRFRNLEWIKTQTVIIVVYSFCLT